MSESPKTTRLPRGIWMLGFVSMFMDISSEMIHSLLPLFMATELGTGALAIGIVEGVAESTALIVKIFSGPLSDYLGARKGLAVVGYALGALSKPLFAIAPNTTMVLAARFSDRIGKGIRGAPRDALVADLAPPEQRGAAFGLRQSLDTIGAFTGPLLATGLMLWWANDFRSIFWAAMLPGLVSVLLLALGVQEPATKPDQKRQNPIRWEILKALPRAFWWVVVAGVTLTLARFSEAFLVLRAQNVGIALPLVPLVMVWMNVVYSLSAYPLGKLADRLPHRRLLAIGILFLIVSDLILAKASHWSWVLLAVAFWGLHMGATQGLLSAMVAHTAPASLRGTAFGFFNLASGISMLCASGIAGLLWQTSGPQLTFLAGAFFSFCSLLLLRFGGGPAVDRQPRLRVPATASPG